MILLSLRNFSLLTCWAARSYFWNVAAPLIYILSYVMTVATSLNTFPRGQSLPECYFYRNTNVLRERTSTNPSHRNSFRSSGWYKSHTLCFQDELLAFASSSVRRCSLTRFRPERRSHCQRQRSLVLMSPLTSVQSLNHLPGQPLVPSCTSYSPPTCNNDGIPSLGCSVGESRKEGRGAKRKPRRVIMRGLYFPILSLHFEKLTGYPAADGMWRRLPGFLHVSRCRPRKHALARAHYAHTCRVYAYPPPKAHLLRILPWDGTEAGSVAAALLFTLSLQDERKKRRKTGDSYPDGMIRSICFILLNQKELCLSLRPTVNVCAFHRGPGVRAINTF